MVLSTLSALGPNAIVLMTAPLWTVSSKQSWTLSVASPSVNKIISSPIVLESSILRVWKKIINHHKVLCCKVVNCKVLSLNTVTVEFSSWWEAVVTQGLKCWTTYKKGMCKRNFLFLTSNPFLSPLQINVLPAAIVGNLLIRLSLEACPFILVSGLSIWASVLKVTRAANCCSSMIWFKKTVAACRCSLILDPFKDNKKEILNISYLKQT